MRAGRIAGLISGAVLLLSAGCSSTDVNRNLYEALRTREQLQPAPGADRKMLPDYDDYQRGRTADR